MDLRLHIGAHRTATRHLRAMLAANAALLEAEGVRVLPAEAAERAFARAIRDLREGQPIDKVNAALMAALIGESEPRRIVIVDPNISGSLLRPMGKEYFYPRVSITLQRIVNVLDGLPMRVFCALRNPATFIPSCYAAQQRHHPEISYEQFLGETNLPGLRWSDYLHRTQLKDGALGITAYRFEDYPKIWRNVVQALTGIRNREALVGAPDPVDPGLSLRGALLMHDYLADRPAADRAAFDKVQAAFARKFPSGAGHVDPLLWPEELVQGMTENYDDDWYYIERMDNLQALNARVYA